jgi:hypothetical protein
MILDAAETVLGFFGLIDLLTAVISREIMGEGSGGGMKN